MKGSKELQEIAKKDSMKITKEDIVKILKAYHAKNPGNPGYSIDIESVANGIFLSKEEDPERIEKDLMEIVPKKEWLDFNYVLVDHGRKICKARKPLCLQCVLNKLCPSANRF